MLSHDTTRKIRELQDKVDEIMGRFKVTRDEAWNMLTASGAYKAVDVAKKIDERQEQLAIAQKRANAAYSSTFTSNIEYKE